MEYKLDIIDTEILTRLIENARIPFTEIAKALVVSTGTVHQRVRKMEAAGIIKGYSLNIDYEKMGYHLTVYIGLFVENMKDGRKLVEELSRIPEITVAHLASGRYGVFCKMRCRNTSHARDVLFEIQAIRGIKGTETMVMFEESLNSNKLLLKTMLEEFAKQ